MARTAAVPRPALAGHLHRSLATVSHQVPLGSGTSIPVDLDDQQTKTLRPTDEMQGFDISAQESSTPRSVSPLPLLARSRNQLRNPLAACASYADTVPRAQQPGERRPPDLPRRPGDHPDGPSRARRHAALHDQHGARPSPPPPPPSLYSCLRATREDLRWIRERGDEGSSADQPARPHSFSLVSFHPFQSCTCTPSSHHPRQSSTVYSVAAAHHPPPLPPSSPSVHSSSSLRIRVTWRLVVREPALEDPLVRLGGRECSR